MPSFATAVTDDSCSRPTKGMLCRPGISPNHGENKMFGKPEKKMMRKGKFGRGRFDCVVKLCVCFIVVKVFEFIEQKRSHHG